MRIAYITETFPPEVNGVSLTVERSVRYLRDRGHRVTLIRPQQRGEALRDDDDEWLTRGAPIPLYSDLRLGLASTQSLVGRLTRLAPHLVHVATPGPLGRAAVMAACRLELPVTTDFRTNFHDYSHYYRLGWLAPMVRHYLRVLHNRADCSFVPVASMRDALAEQGFERLEVIGRGVDSKLFTPARRSAALRAEWGANDDDTPVALYVGRLAREKNIDLALRAFAATRARMPRARLVVVGDGPLGKSLRAEQMPNVVFAGVQRGAALAACYASADVFLFPSQSETFGNVTLEALASGLAVVAFDRAAAAAHIRDGRNGWLAHAGDESGFISAAQRAITASRWRASMLRIRARQAALNADWATVLERFERRLQHYALPNSAEQRQGHVALA